MTRAFCSSLSDSDSATSKTASMREAVTLACWPPGPEERLARSSISACGIATERVIGSGSSTGIARHGRSVGARLEAAALALLVQTGVVGELVAPAVHAEQVDRLGDEHHAQHGDDRRVLEDEEPAHRGSKLGELLLQREDRREQVAFAGDA